MASVKAKDYSGQLERDRVATNFRKLLALAFVTTLVTSCFATDQTSSTIAESNVVSLSIPQVNGTVDAQAGLDTVPAMYDAAEIVVVGTQVGNVTSFRSGARSYPVVTIEVSEYLKGEGTSNIDVLQSATTLDSRGRQIPLVSGPGNFLLFLTIAAAAGAPVRDGLYTPVTEVMGSYFENRPGSGEFVTLDDSNPLLPDTLSPASLEQLVRASG